MNRSIRIVCTLVLISSIISCKKNSDSVSNNTRLSKMIQWNVATPSKSIITKEFIYDAQKRVVEMVIFTGDSVGGEIKNWSNPISFKCFYNGNETTPYKTIGYLIYAPTDGKEVFHTYSKSGEILEDSLLIPPTGKMIRKYNYYTDKIMVQSLEKRNSSTYTTSDSLLLADHNFKESYLTFYGLISQSAGYKISYDNKVNPFNKLNIASLFTTHFNVGFAAVMAPGYCKNNITEFTHGYRDAAGNFTKHGTVYFTYTYNDGGLPTECRLSAVNNMYNTNDSYTIKYEYIE